MGIHIRATTWGCIIFLMAIFALVHRFAKVSIIPLIPAFLIPAFLFLLAMGVIQYKQRRHIKQFTIALMNGDRQEGLPTGSTEGKTCWQKMYTLDETMNTELIMLRILQMGLFFNCYIFASILVFVEGWEHNSGGMSLLIVCCLVVYLIYAFSLPRLVPDFLAVMALPPYLDPDNIGIIKQCLVDHTDHNLHDHKDTERV